MKVCSMFSQILQLFPRVEFEHVVRATGAERHAKGFSSWGQFVAMLFCHLGRAHSLREICQGLQTCEGKLVHLGISTPARSSLAYANTHRPWERFQQLFFCLLECCPHPLRRIEVYNPEKDEILIFLTNHLGFGASTVAAIYKDRWQIELFFNALTQHLKIKTFVGTSANAVTIQVWTVLIAMLLLRYLPLQSRWAWSLSHLVALLRMNLFTYRDLWSWAHDPLGTLHQAESPTPQQAFTFA